MTEQPPPFFLIIADLDREFFCVEGPMIDAGRGGMRPRMPAIMSGGLSAARPARIVMRSPLNTDALTKSAAFRRAAS